MRSAARISRTPREHHDAEHHARQATLAALLAELRRARDTGAEWYAWIADGRPPLTEAEYSELTRGRPARARRRTPAASGTAARR